MFDFKALKVLSIVMLLLLVTSCVKTTYIAPFELQTLADKKTVYLRLKNGSVIKLSGVRQAPGMVIGDVGGGEKMEISDSMIKAVVIKKTDYTAVAYGLLYAGLYAAVIARERELDHGARTAPPRPPPTSGCCPFIYSYDGKEYVFDAEPVGGAICRRLKRTDLCRLEYVKAINDQYRVRVANDLDETQYIDELKLVTVDHPIGTQVAPDVKGKIHVYAEPIAPICACDKRSGDIISQVIENDGVAWQACTDGRNPGEKTDLRDDIVFEFPKPVKARKAKLIINAGNTPWGSYSVRQYLELHGGQADRWYAEMNSFGPGLIRAFRMQLREELFSLKINVATDRGWKTKGAITAGAPFMPEVRIYLLDIGDIEGDRLVLRFAPPVPFWSINYVAVDYGDDVPATITELCAQEVVDCSDGRILPTIERRDNHYAVMRTVGENVTLTFNVPPRPAGSERSVFVKVSGYYEMHLDAQGEPQVALLKKIETEPGYAVQYVLEQYLDWQGRIGSGL